MELITTLIVATFASSGLWSLVMYLIQNRAKKKDALTRMILGLAYREIRSLGFEYLGKGSIVEDEYEDLIKYLYEPYKELGGNGTAEKIINEVKKLPIAQ